MKSYRFNISIQSTPRDVFHVLTDYPNYGKWNPWFVVVRGEAKKGGSFVLKFRSPLALLPLHFEFDRVEKGAILQRRQVGWFRYLLEIERERIMYTKSSGTTLYKTRLTIKGPLAPLFAFVGSRTIRESVKKESLALKEYCEKHYAHPLTAAVGDRNTLQRFQMPDKGDHRRSFIIPGRMWPAT